MQRFDNSVIEFVSKYSSEPDELLKKIERETYSKILRPQMIAGAIQGKVLEMFSTMIQPENILELGTFTGYSTLCLAKGLKPSGNIYTIESNDELENFTQNFFDQSEYKKNIKFIIGDAREIIQNLDKTFDLVFIDADKRQYPEYYELIFDKVKHKGFIIADDVLWYGKINQKVPDNDLYTKGLKIFNEIVKNDKRVENVIVPIRDGLNIIRKL